MKIEDIRKIAQKRGLQNLSPKKTEVIRMIQRDEGYTDCYATKFSGKCGQDQCLWRKDCLIEDKKSG